MFYFELADSHDETVKRFSHLCVKYLSGYKGQTHFSIGQRALQETRPVNATNYDIAVHMIFENYAAYEVYKSHKRHQQFITEVAGMSTGRIVYDSFLDDEDQDESES